MAIDTKAKRFSMLKFGRFWERRPPEPDGTIDKADRAELLGLYRGITLAEPATTSGIGPGLVPTLLLIP